MMKKYSFLGRHLKPLAIAAALACPQLMTAQVEINDTNFPDYVFREYVSNNWDTNPQDGTLSKTEINSITGAYLSSYGIEDFTGIENFTYLTELYVNDNQGLEKLDVSALIRLTTLNASNCALTEINFAGLTKLKTINLNYNQLEALDFTGLERLEEIYCGHNPDLSSINVTGLTRLKSIQAEGCNLTKVDVRGHESLETLYVSDNNDLEEINASGCKNLTSVSYNTEYVKSLIFEGCVKLTLSSYGYMSELTTLNLKGITGLTSLSVYNNPALTNLDVSGCTKLTSLSVYGNESLAAIDVTSLTALTDLSAYRNNLSSIDVTGLTKLKSLYVYGNETLSEIKGLKDLANLTSLDAYRTALKSIDVSGLAKLESLSVYECENLEEINASGCTALTDVPNLYSSSDFKALKILNLSGTGLTSLSISSFPELTTMDVSGCTKLTSLYVYDNESLTAIDVTGCTALTYLGVIENNLASIDVTGLTKLERLDVYGNETLSEIKGLKDLANLTSLDAYRTALKSIDVSGLAKLESLSVYECENLEEINASGCTALTDVPNLYSSSDFKALKILNLSGTGLTSLSISSFPELTTMDVSGCTKLTSLYVYDNESLTAIDVTGCTALEHLDCYRNESLTSLDVSSLSALTRLDAYENNLAALDLSNNKKLTYIDVHNNQLETLTLNNPVLEELNCENNLLTALDVSNSTGLRNLDCSDNQLTTLDVSKNIHLSSLDCENNQLTSLDLSNNTELGWWTSRQQRTIDLVTLSSKEVGFMVDDTFDSENVSSLYVDYSEIEPKYITVYGKRYFVIADDASKATDLKEKPVSYYYKTNKDGYDMEIALTVNEILKSETIIEMDEHVSLKTTFGEDLVAPTVTVREGYDGKISYKSSDETVVKVATDGKLTVVGAGKAVITISGTETNYCLAPADVTYDVEIEKASIKPVVTLEGWTYAEKANLPVVKDNPGNGKETYTYKVKGAADDTYSATVPTDAGEYTVKVLIAETNNYLSGEATADFTISPKALAEDMVEYVEVQFYSGSAIEPEPAVKDGNSTLTEGTDYTLAYSDNTEIGTATITITGKGNYQGTVTIQFVIRMKGDVNGDGIVGVGDLISVSNYMAVGAESGVTLEQADVNKDGEVDASDLISIRNIMAGKEEE